MWKPSSSAHFRNVKYEVLSDLRNAIPIAIPVQTVDTYIVLEQFPNIQKACLNEKSAFGGILGRVPLSKQSQPGCGHPVHVLLRVASFSKEYLEFCFHFQTTI